MRIATLDMETDPFKHGRVPLPFACGLYDGEQYVQTWGDNCVSEMLEKLWAYPHPLVIYAHNGGKFDFWYLAHAIKEPLLFVDSRLVKGGLYHHELRDSFKILPVPLAQIQKDEIDYKKMERNRREKHRAEISKYLRSDCVYLYDAVAKFILQFGDVLTIGGAAMRELRKDYKVEHLRPEEDKEYRQFFHGGRCECFETGVIKGRKKKKLYDVNSMYPFVCAEYMHPVGPAEYSCADLPDDAPFYLAHIRARSRGALPMRTKSGLAFPHCEGEFFVTSHELRMGIKLGLVDVLEVIRCHVWQEVRSFEKFIGKFNAAKIACEERGDSAGRLFNKLILNNAYGRFAINPERFKDFQIFETLEDCLEAGFSLEGELGERIVGAKPATIKRRDYANVATAASITGAARTVLLHAIACAERPIYCDTDSLWCENLPLLLDQTKLGAWKFEAAADTLYIAGKKLYAAKNRGSFYVEKKGKKAPLKCASKGVVMKPEQIAKVALGEELRIKLEAPSLRVGREAKFIARNIARRQKLQVECATL